jgi:hypothetical protein
MLDCATWSELCARPMHNKTKFRPHLLLNISYQFFVPMNISQVLSPSHWDMLRWAKQLD